MNKKTVRTGLAVAMGGTVLLTGLIVGASIALADSGETPEETSAETVESFRGRGGVLRGHLADLAEQLDATVDELRAQIRDGATLEDIAADAGLDLDEALAELRETMLAEIDERVASGDLSEERGDVLRERIESFEFGDFRLRYSQFRDDISERFNQRRGFGSLRGFLGDLETEIDLDALRQAVEEGLSLEDALEDAGIDLDSALAEAREAALAHIDDLVADGSITQDQADRMKERIEGFEAGNRGFGFRFDSDGEGFSFEKFDGHRFRGFRGGDGDCDKDADNALRDA